MHGVASEDAPSPLLCASYLYKHLHPSSLALPLGADGTGADVDSGAVAVELLATRLSAREG